MRGLLLVKKCGVKHIKISVKKVQQKNVLNTTVVQSKTIEPASDTRKLLTELNTSVKTLHSKVL